jgi:hypothetical protein
MRALAVAVAAVLLNFLVVPLAADAASTSTNPVVGEWSGSISPKTPPSQSARVSIRDNGTVVLVVTRSPKPGYAYTGKWSYRGGQLSMTFTQISPHATPDAFWPLNLAAVGSVSFDKGGKKMFVRYAGDPWLMTLFKP